MQQPILLSCFVNLPPQDVDRAFLQSMQFQLQQNHKTNCCGDQINVTTPVNRPTHIFVFRFIGFEIKNHLSRTFKIFAASDHKVNPQYGQLRNTLKTLYSFPQLQNHKHKQHNDSDVFLLFIVHQQKARRPSTPYYCLNDIQFE